MPLDQLKATIQKLDDEGQLEDIIEHNDTRYKILNNARYANLGASSNESGDDVMVPLYGIGNAEGNIIINRSGSFKEVACPNNLRNKQNVYAINLCTRRLGSLISNRAVLYIDPTEVVSSGDIALYYISENETKLLSIREDENGQLYGMRWNPDERINFSNEDLTKIHKVAVINL